MKSSARRPLRRQLRRLHRRLQSRPSRRPPRHLPYRRVAVASLLPLVFAGCTSFSNDGGFDRVRDIARSRLHQDLVDPTRTDDAEIRRRIDALIAEPLTDDAAVQVALLSNRSLRAAYRELGIAEADLVQAGRLPNPGLEFRHTSGDGFKVIERTFVADLAALITLPLATRVERSRFDAVKLQVADAVLRTAADTRRAWIAAVAADEHAAYARQVVEASEASADLAAQMRATGNWSALAEARERAFDADAVVAAAQAVRTAVASRERLTRLLGLSGESIAYRLPSRLPDLPAEPTTIADAERDAMAHRLDLEADRVANRRLAQSLGVVQVTRFVDAFTVARAVDDQPDEPPQRGYAIRIEVPLFDFGDARVARSEAVARQALERTAQHAIDAASEVRERTIGYRAAWELAQHYRTVVLPLRQRISAENLLRYHGGLIGVFELIADAREQAAGVVATLDALRDFWIAEADLAEALGGRLPPAIVATSDEAPR